VLDDQGFGSFASLAAGLSEIYSSNVRSGIITMSLGTRDGTSSAITSLMTLLMTERDFIIVASAGNDNVNSCLNYPSNIPGVLSIGAIDITNYRAFYSNYGSCVTLYSFGTNVISCGTQPTTSLISSGTSMAAPIVAGTLAVYKQVNPSLTNVGLKNLMIAKSSKGLIKALDSASPNNVIYNGLDSSNVDTNGPGPSTPTSSPAASFDSTFLSKIVFITFLYIVIL
jgi:serine protease